MYSALYKLTYCTFCFYKYYARTFSFHVNWISVCLDQLTFLVDGGDERTVTVPQGKTLVGAMGFSEQESRTWESRFKLAPFNDQVSSLKIFSHWKNHMTICFYHLLLLRKTTLFNTQERDSVVLKVCEEDTRTIYLRFRRFRR